MGVHDEETATRQGVVVGAVGDAAVTDRAVALLDAAESRAGMGLVDEAERVRLDALAASPADRAAGWHPVLAHHAGTDVGYAGVVVPAEAGGTAVGDLAVGLEATDRRAVLAALLAGLEGTARRHLAGHLQVWLRHADDADLATVVDEGYRVERRLAILGRDLPVAAAGPPTPAGVTVRGSRTTEDDAAIAEVLAATYAGTPEAGWDVEQVRARFRLPWYRPEDVLLAEDADGRLLGLHWLKRRAPRIGEVYNLAVQPEGQGRGLGAVLLHAGLQHLAENGCREVLLWVDRANQRAVRLYTAQGFVTRWEDVAFGRTLPDPAPARR